MEDDLELAEIENTQDISKQDQELGEKGLDIDDSQGQVSDTCIYVKIKDNTLLRYKNMCIYQLWGHISGLRFCHGSLRNGPLGLDYE